MRGWGFGVVGFRVERGCANMLGLFSEGASKCGPVGH